MDDHPSEDNIASDETPNLTANNNSPTNPIQLEVLADQSESSVAKILAALKDQDPNLNKNIVVTNYAPPNAHYGVGCSSSKPVTNYAPPNAHYGVGCSSSKPVVNNDDPINTNFPGLAPIQTSPKTRSYSLSLRKSGMINSPEFISRVFDYFGIPHDITIPNSVCHGNPGTSVQPCTSSTPWVNKVLGSPNLREWSESVGMSTGKATRLYLFRQVARLLDGALSQGVKLLELRPSSFIITENGWNVRYVGRLTPNNEQLISSVDPDTTATSTDSATPPTDNNNGKRKCLEKGVPGDESEGDEKRRLRRDDSAEPEKEWYGFPVGYENGDLDSFNIYCLGLLLFELLSNFESREEHNAAMVDLQQRILPPQFVSLNPNETQLCLWMLHPIPSARPTTSEILEFESLLDLDPAVDEGTCNELIAESDLLHNFLLSLQKFKQTTARKLSDSIQILDNDILNATKVPEASTATATANANAFGDKLLDNIGKLETAYFSLRSREASPQIGRPDREILRDRNSWSTGAAGIQPESVPEEGVWACFESICKFARHSSFEVCGGLKHDDMMNSGNAITSMSLDRDEELIATAGISNKIKIFEVGSLLKDDVDVQYPMVELMGSSRFSCVCWNTYIRNYLVSTEYCGAVQTWDAGTGQGLRRYMEHTEIARSVDFSKLDPTRFASCSDDCSVRLWNTNEKDSMGVIWNRANICCVQFSAYSSHLIAFGSIDQKIYCYDIRNTKNPWCTLVDHRDFVTNVMFLDSETIVSAATDSTLKLWDLNKTSLVGSSMDACVLTFEGHTNEKNFVGLTVLDQYIACGSETNEVYAYHKSLPFPFITHKLKSTDSMDDDIERYVSSVCWGKKSEMLFAANSSGKMNVLHMI